jgi:hypothetical protein
MAWTALTLAQDSDLSKYEPEMPNAAQTVGKSGQSAYASKRELAKRDIAAALTRRGLDPDGVQTASQLTHAAVCLELAYIYRALGRKLDSVDIEKANYYQATYEEEIEHVVLDYEDPGTVEVPQARPAPIYARG